MLNIDIAHWYVLNTSACMGFRRKKERVKGYLDEFQMTMIYCARLRIAQGSSRWESFGQRSPIIHPKFWNWDVKIIQEIRRKDSDKMVQSFHEVVA
jgi:hypothetical protein